MVWINPCQHEKTKNRSFFSADVTDMYGPHLHMVDKLGILCEYIKWVWINPCQHEKKKIGHFSK
jgi:hypothetical protein